MKLQKNAVSRQKLHSEKKAVFAQKDNQIDFHPPNPIQCDYTDLYMFQSRNGAEQVSKKMNMT